MTPYITADMLRSAPTGISWSTIPGIRASVGEVEAELANICARATATIDGYCNQPLRATLDTEELYGPDFRVTVESSTGVTRCLLSRTPVLSVSGVQVSAASTFPPQWSPLADGKWRIEKPVLGVYGSSAPGAAGGSGGPAVLLAPGYVSHQFGRNAFLVEVTYVNGWPHTVLTQPVSLGQDLLYVDDCTGWEGATGTLFDGASQEAVTVASASATAGPGTLTLTADVASAHGSGVLLSTLPPDVHQAAIYYCVAEALTRGATATTVQALPGSQAHAGGTEAEELVIAAELLLDPYRRII